jgi:GntR family transcriptional regulator, rspAB operon transcriptional repressor
LEKLTKLSIKKPLSIREKVYMAVRNEILDGEILPGERLIETKLAKNIKTSRTPVREALHMLEREGFLESIPRVGYRVRSLKWDEVEEICEIRAVNEILAARWAMKRVTPRETKALEDNLAASEADLKSRNLRSFVEHDGEFHEILVRASGSERLLELCQMLRRHMLRYRIKSLYLVPSVRQAIEDHRRIVLCIMEKDEQGVDSAIRDHLEFVKKSVQRYAFEIYQDAV